MLLDPIVGARLIDGFLDTSRHPIIHCLGLDGCIAFVNKLKRPQFVFYLPGHSALRSRQLTTLLGTVQTFRMLLQQGASQSLSNPPGLESQLPLCNSALRGFVADYRSILRVAGFSAVLTHFPTPQPSPLEAVGLLRFAPQVVLHCALEGSTADCSACPLHQRQGPHLACSATRRKGFRSGQSR